MHYFDKDTGLSSAGAGRLYSDERGNAKRIVLLVVLLLVLAAAAVMLLYPDLISPPEPETANVADSQVKRKVVQLPKQTDTTKPEAQTAATQPAAAKPEAQTAATQPAAAKPAAQTATTKPATAPTGPYTVTAGAFLLKSSVDQADDAVRKLGYAPYHSKVTRDIEVVRLREGTYGETEARSRVAEYVKGIAPEAFVMKVAKGWSVYLGSYVGLDRARVYADRLYAQGVHVSEEKAVVSMALTLVRFGDFPDQAAAGQAVTKAKAAGIEAYVSKVR